jgi:hypothetical protein
MSASSPVIAAIFPMRTPLSKRPHLPHEARTVFEGRQLNARPAFRLDNARQLKRLKSCFWGLGTAPSYAIEIEARGTISR